MTELHLDPDGLPLEECPYPPRDLRILAHDLPGSSHADDWDIAAEAIRDLVPAVVALRWAPGTDRTADLTRFVEHTGLTALPTAVVRDIGSFDTTVLYDARILVLEDHQPDMAPDEFREIPLSGSTFTTRTPALTFSVAHAHGASTPQGREAQARWIATHLTPTDTIVIGDLRTIGARDPEPDHTRVPPAWHACHRTVRADLVPDDEEMYGPTDRTAINLLHRHGFREPAAILGIPVDTTPQGGPPRARVEPPSVRCLVTPSIAPHIRSVGTAATSPQERARAYTVDIASPEAQPAGRVL